MFLLIANFMPFAIVHPEIQNLLVRELPKNNLPILLALLPVFYVVITGT